MPLRRIKLAVHAAWTLAIATFALGVLCPQLARWESWDGLIVILGAAAAAVTIHHSGYQFAQGTRDVNRREVRRIGKLVEISTLVEDAETGRRPAGGIHAIPIKIGGEHIVVGLADGATLDIDGVMAVIDDIREEADA